MIRPITCVTFLLACGTGLYLYQAKHRAYVLDTEIEQVVRETEAVREQTRILRAEWTLLDQPERLQRLATSLLNLQPTKPAQFVSLADLDNRLPPVPPPESAPSVVAQSSADPDQSQATASGSAAPPSEAEAGSEPIAKPGPNASPTAAPKPPPHPAEHPAAHMAEQAHPHPAEHPAERTATRVRSAGAADHRILAAFRRRAGPDRHALLPGRSATPGSRAATLSVAATPARQLRDTCCAIGRLDAGNGA